MDNIIQGDCLEKLKELDDNSVDSIVTDPPYELGFMGKKWDNTGIAYNVEMWKQAYRVLKPGGHLLSFSGTRTYHRMAVAIEDAGFEVRDMIEWVYGSGFPKSLNIGKKVDELQGNEREVVRDRTGAMNNADNSQAQSFTKGDVGFKTHFTETKGTSEWEGWGTALKPAHESICVAQKRLDCRSDIDYTVSICQTLFAQIVKKSSELNLSEKIQQSIAQWLAEKNINTLEDLSEVMDMLPSESEKSLSWNIVWLWLNILKETWKVLSMSTIKTELNLTTELKILKSLEWENIFQGITQASDKTTDGNNADAVTAGVLFCAVRLKLNYTHTHSAQGDATSKENKLDFAPNHEPICMARKPISEKTVAENCLKWGTGGINIDESRVGETGARNNGNSNGTVGSNSIGVYGKAIKQDYNMGRFPTNLIHDNSEEVRECFPNESERFFKSIIYTAKASKSERNKGCEGLEEKDSMKWAGGNEMKGLAGTYPDGTPRPTQIQKNNHPTVKPIALMEYLIKMVTKPGGIVLDPFAGSGSTLVAAKELGFQYIGIEKEEEYIKIAQARLGAVPERLL